MTTAVYYKVNAIKGLNLRAAPSMKGKPILALQHDAIVTRIGDPTLADDWHRVRWNGHEGYAASAYLAPVSAAKHVDIARPSGELILPPVPPVGVADRDPARLHPAVRKAVFDTLAYLRGRGIDFRIYEGFRTPERQAFLHESGRTRPGPIVTQNPPWRSTHQYGLAADLVLFTDHGWNWDASGSNAAKWAAMHAAAKAHGLKPLNVELSHVEPVNANWQRYITGDLPGGGDESWHEAVTIAAERWRNSERTPHGPALTIAQRPALEED